MVTNIEAGTSPPTVER